jgi:hypothetical protein
VPEGGGGRTKPARKPRPTEGTAASSAAGAPDGGADKRPLGRPPHRPTAEQRRQVEVMAGRFMPQEAIAAVLGICDDTLRRHYAEELRRGDGLGCLKLSTKFEGLIDSGNVPAILHGVKVKLGLSERVKVEHSGEVRGGLDVYLRMTEDELLKRLAELDAALAE